MKRLSFARRFVGLPSMVVLATAWPGVSAPLPFISLPKPEAGMKIAKLIAWSAIAFSLSVWCGSEADALDNGKVTDARKAVGTVMIVTGEGNPFDLPPGIVLVNVTATLIHPQVLLTAGHFTFFGTEGVPPFLRLVVSFSPEALDESTWISIDQGPGTQVVHPSFPPGGIDDIDGLPEPGVADVGLIFLDSPITDIKPAKLAKKTLKHRDIGDRMKVVGYGVTGPEESFDGFRRIGRSTLGTLLDQNWASFNFDPVTICFGDSGGPTYHKGRIVAIASDGGADCASADWRARVDTRELKSWIKETIRNRFGHWDDD